MVENIKPNNQAYELFLFEFQYPVKFWTSNALVPITGAPILYTQRTLIMELLVFGLASELRNLECSFSVLQMLFSSSPTSLLQ